MYDLPHQTRRLLVPSSAKQPGFTQQLIAAYRQDRVEPTRNCGTTSLFSPKQQAIVAWIRHAVTYMDVKTGRPADIRSLSRS